MHLQVVTPEGAKVDAATVAVTAPGTVGELGILAGHIPVLTSLGIGLLSYAGEGGLRWLAVNGCYMEVADDAIIVITETAESPSDVDVERAKRALARAEAELAALGEDRPEAVAMAAAAKKRAENRIAVAARAKTAIPA